MWTATECSYTKEELEGHITRLSEWMWEANCSHAAYKFHERRSRDSIWMEAMYLTCIQTWAASILTYRRIAEMFNIELEF